MDCSCNNQFKGYIYLRDNDWYKENDVIKMGMTISIKDRQNGYITTEIKRGKFIKIIEINNINQSQLKFIDNLLKAEFKYLNIKYDASTELYKREIEEKLEDFFIKRKLSYLIVNDYDLKRINRNKNLIKNRYNNLLIKLLNSSLITPKDYQLDVLNKIEEFYNENNIGKLLWFCGLGKSIMSLLIAKKLKFKKIIIGVSSCYLQLQFKEEVKLVFGNSAKIIIIGIDSYNDDEYNDNNQIYIIITTYHSSHLFTKYKFDFKIGDECHHLVNYDNKNKDTKTFIKFHEIKSTKSLFMTATERILVSYNHNLSEEDSYSMNNEKIFGKLIDEKNAQWAIDNNYITDYSFLIIKNSNYEVNIIKDRLKSNIKNRDLYISAYIALKSLTIKPPIIKVKDENQNEIEVIALPPTHQLIYTNTIKDADLVNEYIKEIIDSGIIDIDNIKENLYHKSLHSGINSKEIKKEIEKFEKSKYGIIPCVQIFGEGVNCPILNSVCIACNMISEISIYQKIFRPNRKIKCINNKIAYYIIPSLSEEEFKNTNHIIKQLSFIDKTIEQKIKVLELKQTTKTKLITSNEKDNHEIKDNNELMDNEELLLKIKLQLKYNKTLNSDFTEEQNEYNYIQSINKSLKLESRDDYYKSKDTHSNYIENPFKYFSEKGVWNNWSDFLGYDTSILIPTKEKWLIFCNEKEIKTMNDYKEAINIYKELPKDPHDFYNDFANIEYELSSISITIRKRR
jgi:predicted helicase